MEMPAFTRVNLSNVRVIIVIMCVLMEELLCQTVMEWIPVLECPLSGVCGRLWLRPVMADIKWHCFPRSRLQWRLPSIEKPLGAAAGGPVRAEPGYEEEFRSG
jgi:hypothetical protein